MQTARIIHEACGHTISRIVETVEFKKKIETAIFDAVQDCVNDVVGQEVDWQSNDIKDKIVSNRVFNLFKAFFKD